MRPWTIAWLAIAAGATFARPVVIVMAPDEPYRSICLDLADALVQYGGVGEDDVLLADDLTALDERLADEQLDLGRDDRLTILLSGRLGREAGQAVLDTDRGRFALLPVFERLARLEVQSLAVIAGLRANDGVESLQPLERWPEETVPVVMLSGDAKEFLESTIEGLTWLLADDDADGFVDGREVQTWANRRLNREAGRLAARPAERHRLPVAGLGGEDVTAPLVLVTEPTLRDDGPVLRERAGALRIRGVVADDRKVDSITVNAQPALLMVANDLAAASLGLPGRAVAFEASVPLPEQGMLEVHVSAVDRAGNAGEESFLVWVGRPDVVPRPAPETVPASSACRVDAVRLEWGQTEDWRYGFRVRLAATVRGRQGRACRAAVRFRLAGGPDLMDFNGEYRDTTGRVAATVDFKPQYDNTVLRDLTVFVPQRELHLAAGRQHRLEAVVVLLDIASEQVVPLAESDPVPFELAEPAQTATVMRLETEHNQREGEVRGLRFHAGLHIAGMKDAECQVAIYVQHADGRPLLDRNQRFRAGDGTVAVFRDFRPGFDSAKYDDLPLFLPYDELHLTEPGEQKLRVRVALWDKANQRLLDASSWRYFSVTLR